MMATTKRKALVAGLELLGEHGIRALTHARVDERAGLPKGSTSNWFRTREALIAGLVSFLAESEREDFAAAALPAIDTPEQLVEALCGMIAVETGQFAGRTRARFSLFLEGAGDPGLLEPLLAQRRAYVEWTTSLLARVGARSPGDAVRALMATGDGLVLHRVTVDPDAEIRPVIERAVRACME